MLSSLPFALVAPVLGMAEGALADFTEMAKVRTTRGAVAGGNNRMAEFATVQARVAEATGSIEAARLTIHHALEKAKAAGEAGDQAGLDVRLENRLAQAFSVKLPGAGGRCAVSRRPADSESSPANRSSAPGATRTRPACMSA